MIITRDTLQAIRKAQPSVSHAQVSDNLSMIKSIPQIRTIATNLSPTGTLKLVKNTEKQGSLSVARYFGPVPPGQKQHLSPRHISKHHPTRPHVRLASTMPILDLAIDSGYVSKLNHLVENKPAPTPTAPKPTLNTPSEPFKWEL